MKLPFYSYAPAGGILVSIQVSIFGNYWDDCPATIHECRDWAQGVTIGQAISNVTERAVRLTQVPNSFVTQEQVGRLNGTYLIPKIQI